MDYKLLAQKLESLLFASGDPLSHNTIMDLLDINPVTLKKSVDELESMLQGHGLVLVSDNNTLSLASAQVASNVIEKMRKEELEKPLGKAGLETLAVVLYRGPVTKADIDYIRGVDSGSIVRNLMIRGLIQRKEKEGVRGYIYVHTIDALRFLGFSHIKDMPGYEEINIKIDQKAQNQD